MNLARSGILPQYTTSILVDAQRHPCLVFSNNQFKSYANMHDHRYSLILQHTRR